MNLKTSGLALGTLSSALGAALATLALSAVPVQTAEAAGTCAAAWSATQVYTGGNTASENGINYIANWWTQGNDPATNSGGSGSGQPWTSQGSCTGGGGGTNPPPTDPPPTNPPPAAG